MSSYPNKRSTLPFFFGRSGCLPIGYFLFLSGFLVLYAPSGFWCQLIYPKRIQMWNVVAILRFLELTLFIFMAAILLMTLILIVMPVGDRCGTNSLLLMMVLSIMAREFLFHPHRMLTDRNCYLGANM
jgi:hypothetical protein